VAYPSPQAPTPVQAPQSRPSRRGIPAKTLAGILLLPLLMLFGFLLCYLLPFHAPAPHGVKVAVAGGVSAAEIGAGLDQQASGAFDVIPVADPEQARQQVLDQAAQAAFVVNGTQATLYTAKADGAVLEETVIAAFTPIAHAENLTLNVVELVPTVPGDSVGNSLFFLGLAWTLSPYLLVVSLVMQPTTLSRRAKLDLIVGVGAFASIAGFLVTYWLGAVPGQALSMLYGFLNFEAVALTVFGLFPFVGRYIIPVALTLFVFVNAPSSGGAIPYQMVPTFFDWLHPVMPLGNLIDAMRSIFYFDGTNMIRPTLVLCAWIAIGAALITVSALLRRARQRPAHPRTPRPGSRHRTRHAASAHRPRRDGGKRHQRLRPPAAHPVRQGHRRHRRTHMGGQHHHHRRGWPSAHAHQHRPQRPLRRRQPARGHPHRTAVPTGPDAPRDPRPAYQ